MSGEVSGEVSGERGLRGYRAEALEFCADDGPNLLDRMAGEGHNE